MDNQLISVIVTAFNVEKYLDRCIESIVTQTYPHLEIILVNDGSTDRTSFICDDWASKDNRVIVIHKKNGGVSDARNTGVRQARGKWLGFVDGDDYISATMFERLYQHRTEKGITVCGFMIEKNGRWKQCPGIDKTLQPLEAVDLYISNELQERYHGVFTFWGSYACNKLYDHCLFDNICYPIGKRFEDVYVIFDLVHKSEFITFISDCEYIYVQHSNSITHDISNIVTELLNARLCQKEQLSKYWNMADSRMDKLIAVEYYEILYRYACLTSKERENYRETAAEAWIILQERGYDYFPVKLKIKLFMCVFCPELFYLLRKIKLKVNG